MKKGCPHLGILFSVSSYIWEDCDLHRNTTEHCHSDKYSFYFFIMLVMLSNCIQPFHPPRRCLSQSSQQTQHTEVIPRCHNKATGISLLRHSRLLDEYSVGKATAYIIVCRVNTFYPIVITAFNLQLFAGSYPICILLAYNPAFIPFP